MISTDNHFLNVLTRSLALATLLSLFVAIADLHSQERDLRAERLVLDDNGNDSTVNTITIRTPTPLTHDLTLPLPEPGPPPAEVRLPSSGGAPSGYGQLGGNNGTVLGTDFLGTTDSTA